VSGSGPIPPEEIATPHPLHVRPPLRAVALVAAGGALGALARVALATRFPTQVDGFPWTTFVENVIGAFLLALVLTLLARDLRAHRRLRLLLCTGVLGAFTTYSTVAEELVVRVSDANLVVAAGYAAATLVSGLAAALLGLWVARRSPWRRREGTT
jgi:fluoride exporter